MTALQAIDRELERLHKELADFQDTEEAYLAVLDEIKRVNEVLVVLALRESKECIMCPKDKNEVVSEVLDEILANCV